ncbi:MAG: class I SAM-dependent methyltransferase [Gemmatimonadota bacterium]
MSSTRTKGVLEEYGRLAPAYDRRWSFYIDRTVRETLRRLRVGPGARVLDVGCGTGALLEALAASRPEAQLWGVDASSQMLEVASRKLGPSVRLERGDAESLPFRDGAFDLVVSTNAFHYFHDPVRALAEMRRVLRAGGRVVITDWCDDYLACRLCALYLRVFRRAHLRIQRLEQCGRLLARAGFTLQALDRYRIDWKWGLMTAVGEKPGS